jgi:hypothetical protein
MKHSDAAKDKPMIKKIADQEIKKHEKRLHGKKMAKGGVTTDSMMKMGRNLARAANQKSG